MGIERDLLMLSVGFIIGILLTNLIYYLILREESKEDEE